MIIEKVLIKTTLKAGNMVWEKGQTLTAPIPEDILAEVKANTGTVEVLKQGRDLYNRPALVSKTKLKKATTTTTIEEEAGTTTTTAPPVVKPKPKTKPMTKLKRKTTKRKIVKRKKK